MCSASPRPNAFVFAYCAFKMVFSGFRTSSFPFESGRWVLKCEAHVNWSAVMWLQRGQNLWYKPGHVQQRILHLKRAGWHVCGLMLLLRLHLSIFLLLKAHFSKGFVGVVSWGEMGYFCHNAGREFVTWMLFFVMRLCRTPGAHTDLLHGWSTKFYTLAGVRFQLRTFRQPVNQFANLTVKAHIPTWIHKGE